MEDVIEKINSIIEELGSLVNALRAHPTGEAIMDEPIAVEQPRERFEYSEIPDKRNCGCHGDLETVSLTKHSETYKGGAINWKTSIEASGEVYVLDLYYSNNVVDKSLDIEIEDCRFQAPIVVYNFKGSKNTVIRFKNCYIDGFRSIQLGSGLHFEFENCTFGSVVSESYMTFRNCLFVGKHGLDGVNPLRDCTFEFCYFCDFDCNASSGKHVDGIQVFGRDNIDAENIVLEKCRFEMPMLPYTSSYVNACVMFQLEFASGKHFRVNNCWLNGGGYTIYNHVKENKVGFKLEDVEFNNVWVGNACAYGIIYPDKIECVYDVKPIESLYITSIWESNDELHFLVTNDTDEDRQLYVEYENGDRIEIDIQHCMGMREIRYPNRKLSLDEFPIDIENVVPTSIGKITFRDSITDAVIAVY